MFIIIVILLNLLKLLPRLLIRLWRKVLFGFMIFHMIKDSVSVWSRRWFNFLLGFLFLLLIKLWLRFFLFYPGIEFSDLWQVFLLYFGYLHLHFVHEKGSEPLLFFKGHLIQNFIAIIKITLLFLIIIVFILISIRIEFILLIVLLGFTL